MVGNKAGALGIACLLALACSEQDGPEAEPPPLVPGSCVNTDCTLPEATPLAPGPLVACEMVQAKAVVIWKTKNGTVPCPYGSCPVIGEDLSLGADGSLWASAWLLYPTEYPMPDPRERAGFALLRFGPSGAQSLSKAVEVALEQGSILERSRGVLASAGGLTWVGPGHGATGVWLRRHNASGALAGARWLIQSALSSLARVTTDHAMVGYSYVESVDHDAQPPLAIRRAGVSRFASEGRLEWNQSAFANLDLARLELSDADEEGAVTVQMRLVAPFGKTAPVLLARIAPNGTVAWTRELTLPIPSAAVGPAGGVFVSYSSIAEGGPFLDALDRDGQGLWRAQIPSFGASDVVAVDSQGRVILAQSELTSSEQEYVLMRVSNDGSRCVRYALDAAFGFETADSGWMSDTPRVVLLGDNRLAFATVAEVGVAELPEIP